MSNLQDTTKIITSDGNEFVEEEKEEAAASVVVATTTINDLENDSKFELALNKEILINQIEEEEQEKQLELNEEDDDYNNNSNEEDLSKSLSVEQQQQQQQRVELEKHKIEQIRVENSDEQQTIFTQEEKPVNVVIYDDVNVSIDYIPTELIEKVESELEDKTKRQELETKEESLNMSKETASTTEEDDFVINLEDDDNLKENLNKLEKQQNESNESDISTTPSSPFTIVDLVHSGEEKSSQILSSNDETRTNSAQQIQLQSSSSFVLKLTQTSSNYLNKLSELKTTSTPDSNMDQVDLFLKDYDFLNTSNELNKTQNESDISFDKTTATSGDDTLQISSDKIDQQLKQIESITNQSLNKYFDKNIIRVVDDLNKMSSSFEPSMYSSSDENLRKQMIKDDDESFTHGEEEEDEENESTKNLSSFQLKSPLTDYDDLTLVEKTSPSEKSCSNEFYAQINQLDTEFESTENICKYILPASSRIDSPKRQTTSSITSSLITSSIDPGSPLMTTSGLGFNDTPVLVADKNLADSLYSSNFSTSSSRYDDIDLNKTKLDDDYIEIINTEDSIEVNLIQNNESPVKSFISSNLISSSNIGSSNLHDVSSKRKTKHSKLLSRELNKQQDKILVKENKQMLLNNVLMENENEISCRKELKEKDCVKIIKNLDELKKSIEEETDNLETDLNGLINISSSGTSIQTEPINQINVKNSNEEIKSGPTQEIVDKFNKIVDSFIAIETNNNEIVLANAEFIETVNKNKIELSADVLADKFNKIVDSFISAEMVQRVSAEPQSKINEENFKNIVESLIETNLSENNVTKQKNILEKSKSLPNEKNLIEECYNSLEIIEKPKSLDLNMINSNVYKTDNSEKKKRRKRRKKIKTEIDKTSSTPDSNGKDQEEQEKQKELSVTIETKEIKKRKRKKKVKSEGSIVSSPDANVIIKSNIETKKEPIENEELEKKKRRRRRRKTNTEQEQTKSAPEKTQELVNKIDDLLIHKGDVKVICTAKEENISNLKENRITEEEILDKFNELIKSFLNESEEKKKKYYEQKINELQEKKQSSFISTEKPAEEQVVDEVDQDKFKEIVDTFIGTDSSKDIAAEQVATKDVEEPVEQVVEETKLSTVQPLQTEEIVNKLKDVEEDLSFSEQVSMHFPKDSDSYVLIDESEYLLEDVENLNHIQNIYSSLPYEYEISNVFEKQHDNIYSNIPNYAQLTDSMTANLYEIVDNDFSKDKNIKNFPFISSDQREDQSELKFDVSERYDDSTTQINVSTDDDNLLSQFVVDSFFQIDSLEKDSNQSENIFNTFEVVQKALISQNNQSLSESNFNPIPNVSHFDDSLIQYESTLTNEIKDDIIYLDDSFSQKAKSNDESLNIPIQYETNSKIERSIYEDTNLPIQSSQAFDDFDVTDYDQSNKKSSEPINIKSNDNKDVDIRIEISPTFYKTTNPFYEDFKHSKQSGSSINHVQQETIFVSNKSHKTRDSTKESYLKTQHSSENSSFSASFNQKKYNKSYFASDINEHVANVNYPNDVEIPIEINTEDKSSKLKNLSEKLNLNLDGLVSREEQLYEIENQFSKKFTKQTDDNEKIIKPIESVRESIKLFNERTQQTPSHTNPFLSIVKKSPKHETINQIQHQKPPQKPLRKISEQQQTGGFDLIKVSIVNKRPVSPDIEDILNGVDEEQYLDKSFVFADDLNKQLEENKRLSSLDPSIANEYECGSIRSGSIYSKDKFTIPVSTSINNIKGLKPTNPFANDVGNHRKSVSPSYENIDVSQFHPRTSESPNNSPNRAKNLTKTQSNQLINVSELNNYKYKYEIESNVTKDGLIKVKDISVIGLSVPANSTTNVTSTTKVFVQDTPISAKQKAMTLDQMNQPHLVKHLFHSEEELLFKDDLNEIQQQSSSRNFNYNRHTSRDKSQERGIFGMFTRLIDAIRSPFSRDRSANSKKKIPIQTTQSPVSINQQKTKQKEYRQSLLSSIEDEHYEDEKIFTITSQTEPYESEQKLPWEKIKEPAVRIQSSSSKIQHQQTHEHKDISPKEVARMRKSMDGKKPWKCCLF